MHLILSLLVIGASAFAANKTRCDALILNLDEDMFRVQMSRNNHLSEIQAAHAAIRPVQVVFPNSRPWIKYIPSQLLTPLLNPRSTKAGLLVISPEGEPLVFVAGENDLDLVDPTDNPEVEVWEGDVRRLLVVGEDWDWVGQPPARRPSGDVGLADFVATHGAALEPLLKAGTLTQKDVLESLVFRGTIGAHALIFLVKTHQDALSPTFIHAFDDGPPFAHRVDLLDSLVYDVPFAEVGPEKLRLRREDQGQFTRVAPYRWLPPLGAAKRAAPSVKDLAWQNFLTTHPEAIDQLLTQDAAPTEARLAHGRLVEVVRESDDANLFSAILIPRERDDRTTEDAYVFDQQKNAWVAEHQLKTGDAFVFPDGRRFGSVPDHRGLGWIGRTDALARLKEAVKAR